MAQLKLIINNRPYDMACDDGQEARVEELATYINQRLDMISKSGAARNENHLLVLTGLVLADEIRELKEAIAAGDGAPVVTSTEAHMDEQAVGKIAKSVAMLAERIGLIADQIGEKAEDALKKAS